MKVAFLGLGIMGRPMAVNLVKAGHDVTVWNRTPGKIVAGACVAATPAEAAKNAEVVWLCVADTKAVEQVLFGSDGVESVLRAGMIVVDSSTIAPSATCKFADRIAARGAQFIDAPVTGSKAGAESGQLVFIAGGPGQAIEKLQPLFSAMGKKVIHIGKTGLGESAKLGMNLMAAMMYEAFAEALTLIRKLDVPPEKWWELIQSAAVRSTLIDNKAATVFKRNFTPSFPLYLMHKDVKLILQAAKESGAKLPALEKVEEVYQMTSPEQQTLDYSATIAVLEKLSGLETEATKA
jgi:3-hydroxyisobutyrate dehydrogenase-like beta-hydroxyacid dehydrogenase